MQLSIDDAAIIFTDSLMVGNHDSITLFGTKSQNNLKDYSRRLTHLLIKEMEELDISITDVLDEIDQFESKVEKPMTIFSNKKIRYKAIIHEYKNTLSYIEKMTLYFKLQQAQLMKEIKLLEKLLNAVSLCSDDLSQHIINGKETLNQKKSNKEIKDVFSVSNDLETWYSRLEKRIHDLEISHAVSLQTQAQIKILHDNSLLMLDKIGGIITNVFPIWQSQMAIMLGVALLETRLMVDETILNTKAKEIEKLSYKTKDKSLDVEQISELNHTLNHELNEWLKLTKNDETLRNNILHVIHQIERGDSYDE